MEDIDDLPQTKSFKSIAAKDKNTWLVVDGLNLAFRYAHNGTKDFIDEYINTINSLANSYKATTIIIACDKGSSTYRKTIYPEYKGDRKEKYEKQTEEEKQKFLDFFSYFDSMVDRLPWTVFRYDGVEADDIAAFLVKNNPTKKIWLVSSDKDWDLLINQNVSRFSYVTRKEVTYDNFFDTYNCSIENYITLKCLQGGDDNIKGVDGIGPKRAIQLIEEYGNIFDLIDSIPLTGKQKFIQNLNNSKDKLILNFQLMDLLTYCEEAIGSDNLADINKRMQKYVY